ncbi:MAG: DinB family protein [Acidobacteria bacterium]|nr:DinB family protein [Acidobacteriota bacterium]
MYRKIEDFQNEWAYETEMTTKLFNNLTDASLAQKVTDEGRTLGFLAWHIVLTVGEMPSHVGLKVEAPAEDAPVPTAAREIAEAFAKAAKSLGEEVARNWTDETLLAEDEMYGQTWKRGMTLRALINHQTHHRGQVTVLMRQAGVPVVGVYGPTKEEWEKMGMAALA